MWWQLTRVLPHMKEEALSPSGYTMENIRVSVGGESLTGEIRETLLVLLNDTTTLHEWENEIFGRLRSELDIADPDDRVFGWLALPAETFVVAFHGWPTFAPPLRRSCRKWRRFNSGLVRVKSSC